MGRLFYGLEEELKGDRKGKKWIEWIKSKESVMKGGERFFCKRDFLQSLKSEGIDTHLFHHAQEAIATSRREVFAKTNLFDEIKF